MVILWTNLEGDKLEPSPTAAVTPAGDDRSHNGDGGQPQGRLKRRVVQVALKPSLPPLFLPLIQPAVDEGSCSPISSNDHEQQDPRLIVVRASDISSPNSGILFHFDPPAVPQSRQEEQHTSPTPSKELPVIYGISLPPQAEECTRKRIVWI